MGMGRSKIDRLKIDVLTSVDRLDTIVACGASKLCAFAFKMMEWMHLLSRIVCAQYCPGRINSIVIEQREGGRVWYTLIDISACLVLHL